MHRLQSDSDSSDDSMENPPKMKSTKASSKRRRGSLDELVADVDHLRNEFFELYETDYPQLQWCIDRLCHIVMTFEEDFRKATKGARDGGAAGIAGATALLAGLALAPFTLGGSVVVAGVGAAVATGGGIYGVKSSCEKERQVKKLRKDIEDELNKFRNKINPMAEKIKDINERIENLLKELDKLEKDVGDVSKYFASTSTTRSIRREDLTALNAQMSIIMRLLGTLAAIIPGVGLLLDLLSVFENTDTLDDMDKLAQKPIKEKINENEMKTKAGEFIVGMRKVIQQLQDIMEEIRKTKDEMAKFPKK